MGALLGLSLAGLALTLLGQPPRAGPFLFLLSLVIAGYPFGRDGPHPTAVVAASTTVVLLAFASDLHLVVLILGLLGGIALERTIRGTD